MSKPTVEWANNFVKWNSKFNDALQREMDSSLSYVEKMLYELAEAILAESEQE